MREREGAFQPGSRTSPLCSWEKLEHVYSSTGIGAFAHPTAETGTNVADQMLILKNASLNHLCDFCISSEQSFKQVLFYSRAIM